MNSFDRNIFGKKINQTRKEQKISSEALSIMCDVNAVYIRQIEKGNRTPSMSVFFKICTALQVSPSYLLDLKFHNNNYSYLNESIKNLSSSQLKLIHMITDELLKINM